MKNTIRMQVSSFVLSLSKCIHVYFSHMHYRIRPAIWQTSFYIGIINARIKTMKEILIPRSLFFFFFLFFRFEDELRKSVENLFTIASGGDRSRLQDRICLVIRRKKKTDGWMSSYAYRTTDLDYPFDIQNHSRWFQRQCLFLEKNLLSFFHREK